MPAGDNSITWQQKSCLQTLWSLEKKALLQIQYILKSKSTLDFSTGFCILVKVINLLEFSTQYMGKLSNKESQKRAQLPQRIACILLSLEICRQRLDGALSRREGIVKRSQNLKSYEYRLLSQLLEICFKIINRVECRQIKMIKSSHKLVIIWLRIMGVHWTILLIPE